MNANDVIKGPLITEKLDQAREKFRQYSFIVDKKATCLLYTSDAADE